MKKRFAFAVLIICLIVGLCSCNDTPEGSGTDGKGKVYFVGVALQYDVPFVDGDGSYKLGILDGTQAPESPFLAGTINDVAEFASAYGVLLDEYGIEHEDYLMIQKGTPWYPAIDCSYSVKSNNRSGYTYTINKFRINGSAPDASHFEAVKNAYKTWIKTNTFAPTKANIINLLTKTLKEKVKKGDLVVFQYSGHGLDTRYGAEKRGAMSLLPSEFCPYMDRTDMRTDVGDSELLLKDLFEALDVLPCKKAVVFDSCYSGQSVMDGQGEFHETGMGSYVGSSAQGVTDFRTGLYSSTAVSPDMGILAASDYKHQCMDRIALNEEDYFECHGLMMNYVLQAFGWHHSKDKYKTIRTEDLHGTCDCDITVHGYSDGKPAFEGPLSIETVFSYVKPLQDADIRSIGRSYQLSTTAGATTVLFLQ